MIKSSGSIDQVKKRITDLKEQEFKVTLNLGRNKIVSYYGRLKGVYPALFTVSPLDESFKGKTSYSYQEYLCGRVKIDV